MAIWSGLSVAARKNRAQQHLVTPRGLDLLHPQLLACTRCMRDLGRAGYHCWHSTVHVQLVPECGCGAQHSPAPCGDRRVAL